MRTATLMLPNAPAVIPFCLHAYGYPVVTRVRRRRTGNMTVSLLWLAVSKCMRYEETPDFD